MQNGYLVQLGPKELEFILNDVHSNASDWKMTTRVHNDDDDGNND